MKYRCSLFSFCRFHFCSRGRHACQVNVQGVRSERSADPCAWKLHRKVTLDKEVPGVWVYLCWGNKMKRVVISSWPQCRWWGESASVLVLIEWKGESAHLSNLSVEVHFPWSLLWPLETSLTVPSSWSLATLIQWMLIEPWLLTHIRGAEMNEAPA